MALPTLPGGGQRVTVDMVLRQPRLMLRALNDLTLDRFVADQIFARGSAEQVAGGAALFSRSESIYMDREPEEVGPRARYPRAGWTTELFAAAVKKYGLEVPITDEMRRRNQVDELERGQLRLANSMVRFVDGLAINLFLNDPDVQTASASGQWSTAATDVIKDIATARAMIINIDQGYEPDTLIVSTTQELDLLIDEGLRSALPRETQNSPLFTGRVLPMLGLRQILSTNRLADGTYIVLASRVVGTIADEEPLPDEKYMRQTPTGSAGGGGSFSPVYLKLYRHEDNDESIARAARFPAMWIREPEAAVVGSGA